MIPNPTTVAADTSTPNLSPATTLTHPAATLDAATLDTIIAALRDARRLADDEDITEVGWPERCEITMRIDAALSLLRPHARDLAARLQ